MGQEAGPPHYGLYIGGKYWDNGKENGNYYIIIEYIFRQSFGFRA